MHDTHEYVSVAEAAVRLGLSPTTIRERIRAGTLEAERVARPQGTAFLVRVPARAQDAQDDAQPHVQGRAGDARQDTPRPEPAPPDAAAAFVPFLAELAAVRATSEARAERIAELERENATNATRAEYERARADALGRELEAERAKTWWDRLRRR